MGLVVFTIGLIYLSLLPVITDDDTNQNKVIQYSDAVLGITPQPEGNLCPSNLTLESLSWEDMIANPPVSSGLGYAMLEEDLPGATTLGWNTFQIEPNTPIQGKFHLFYPDTPANSDKVDLRYIVILNQQQIPAFEDEPRIYHDLTLRPSEQAALDLRLPPLPAGIHDLIVLGLVETELNNYGDVIALTYRATLVIGDDPQPATQAYQLLEPDAYKSGDEAFFNLSLHSDKSQNIWVWPNIYKPAGDTLDFYASLGYMERKTELAKHGISPHQSPFAILAFLDSKQIGVNSEKEVFYGAVTPNTLYSFIPMSIKTLTYDQGRHDLLVLRINYPWMPMCWLKGAEGSYQFDGGLYAAKVGVEFE